MTESRLDRLFKLLDATPSPAYRRLAAKQLGALVQADPSQARTLLNRLEHQLFSQNWDTRIAGGYVVDYIFAALPNLFIKADSLGHDAPSCSEASLLRELDLKAEIAARRPLLASAGSEFDLDLTISAADRLRIGRANVKKTLGLDEIAGMEDLERELVRDEDLAGSHSAATQTQAPQSDLEKLSARERSALKRKARLSSQSHVTSKHVKRDECAEVPGNSRNTASGAAVNAAASSSAYFDGIESDAVWFCEKMKENLLNPKWQIRHGALLGLRGVISHGIPKFVDADDSRESWCDYLLADVLLVLGLDRFGDYVGDQMVAPVKETAAQLLAHLMKQSTVIGLNPQGSSLDLIIRNHLTALLTFDLWQVRHSGLLAIKQILIVWPAAATEISCALNERVGNLLSDGDEDVRAVSADVLSLLIREDDLLTALDCEGLKERLTGLLLDLDEVSPSVAAILDLILRLAEKIAFDLDGPQLIPFIRHPTVRVRRLIVEILQVAQISEKAVDILLIQLIQSLAVELDRSISDATLKLIEGKFHASSSCSLSSTQLTSLLEIAKVPLGSPYNPSNFHWMTLSGGAPEHDLAFKKSDMMLIGEEEAFLQRKNVALALRTQSATKALNPNGLLESSWCLHHLLHLWIFNTNSSRACLAPAFFGEEASRAGLLLSEFNQFAALIGGERLENLNLLHIQDVLADFNTCSREKSVEAIQKVSILKSTLEEFSNEHDRWQARFNVCHAKDRFELVLKALKIESVAVLQEFYVGEMIEALQEQADELDIEQLQAMAGLCSLQRAFNGEEADGDLASIVSSSEWIDFVKPGDLQWRGGQFLFKRLAHHPVLVSKSLKIILADQTNAASLDFLVSLAKNMDCKEIAEILMSSSEWASLLMNLLKSSFESGVEESEVLRAIALLAQVVRVEGALLARFECIEGFLHMFCGGGLEKANDSCNVLLAILELVQRAELLILPVIPVLLRRVLSEINSSVESVRKVASLAFSQLVRLAPLGENGLVTSPEASPLSSTTLKEIASSREFLSQLQGPTTNLPDFRPPCPINAELRPYQQDGLNWLAFLRKFNLHGALCDDMGLGKTLQTLCIIASDHFEANAGASETLLRSLVVCPSSLCGHWEAEVRQYCPTIGNVLLYNGSSGERRKAGVQVRLQSAELVVTSYDILRSDIEIFTALGEWNYCVLDEGHLIKNPRTKLSAAIRQIRAKRRLLLSGTPIQNNLLELWALFDFLLPGYLGAEREFNEKYAKPIAVLQHQQALTRGSTSASAANPACASASGSAAANTNVSKWTQRDFEEAEKKLAALHKQALPFILRRMKEDVLKDLPPKIIQDYTSMMSPIQQIIYNDLLKNSALRAEISEYLTSKYKSGEGGGQETAAPVNSKKEKNMHVFQALQYLRKLCIHPNLVVSEDHPLMREIETELDRNNLKMTDLAVAPKFQMLKELLVDCGLGDDDLGESASSTAHRVLIFAQHKKTLDLIEELVFRPHLPSLTYLRLDGGVEPANRYSIVDRFNTDPTIDVLLLTTHVGGLGLNLTTADTVIFMDPDWNPMRDLQAMDRAHRLGQKRVVTVYRLLLQDSLEARIMGLQRWKMLLASTVVTQQNSSFSTMQTGELMNLFEDRAAKSEEASAAEKGSGAASMEESSTEKWLKRKGLTAASAADDDLDGREAEYTMEFGGL